MKATVAQFRAADAKVTEIENTLDMSGYGFETIKEYEVALQEAQRLYNELEEQGINPF